jgi:hypothetical protein
MPLAMIRDGASGSLLVLLGLLGGCATPGVLVDDVGQRARYTRIAEEVSALRGLDRLRPIHIAATPPEEPVAQADSNGDASDTLRALGFIEGRISANRLAHDVHSMISGTYTHADDVIRLAPMGDGKVPSDEAVAHEIVHALQAQHFHPSVPDNQSFDEGLAFRSLVEGDAALVERVIAERRKGQRTANTYAAVRTEPRLAADAAFQRGVAPDALQGMPSLVRDCLWFLYFSARRFVALVHGAGGYSLVNRMFRNPPESTEQVLHVDRYLAGDRPIVIPEPAAPAGYREVGRGRLGELGIDALLGRCLPLPVSQAAAAGWGGDSFLVARNDKGDLALLWATAWDDEVAAARFEAALHSFAELPCWASFIGSEWKSGKKQPAETVRVIRAGVRVAATRALAPEVADEVTPRLLDFVATRPPPKPPLGNTRIVDPSAR